MDKGNYGVMVGLRQGVIQPLELEEVVSHERELDLNLYKLIDILD